MLGFVLRRLFYGVLVIWGVITIVFFLFFALPGDPVSTLLGGKGDEITRQRLTRDLGLDQPFLYQYAYYLNDIMPLAVHQRSPEAYNKYRYFTIIPLLGQYGVVVKLPYLRQSYILNKSVALILYEDIVGTIVLAITAMFFATVIGIGLGVAASLRPHTWVDYSIITLTVLGISTPSFVLAILVGTLFGFYLANYTGLNLTGSLWQMDMLGNPELQLRNLILPALTLSLRPLAIIVQLTRSAMLDVLSQDYIRTARAKGLSFALIVWRHALKNALNPVITAVSGWLASLLAGAFFIEYIFNWKGLGLTTIQAVNDRDLPIVMGATVLIAVVFVIINILVDILYAMIDPRVRLE